MLRAEEQRRIGQEVVELPEAPAEKAKELIAPPKPAGGQTMTAAA